MRRIVFCAVFIQGLFGTAAAAQEFRGQFEFRWLDRPNGSHREVKLLSEVSFKDAGGKVWKVPANTVVDGASIPRLLWTFSGSPYVGRYRRASVIHDHYCDKRTELQRDVHRMFKEGMLADGASLWEAYSKYAAVKLAGLCPEKDGIAESEFNSFLKSRPDAFGDQVADQFNAPLTADDAPNARFQQNREVARAVLQESEQIIYDRLVDLKADATQENLQALEAALRDINVGEQRFEELVVLAAFTFPSSYPDK